VEALSQDVKAEVLRRVREFKCFTDFVWEERDYGYFEIAGEGFFFKINYMDRVAFEQGREIGSVNSADPEKTVRILTIGALRDS